MMEHRQQRLVVKGMTKDLSTSKFDPDFAYNILNLRMTARDNGTLLSVTNERSSLGLTIYNMTDLSSTITIEGTIVGYELINLVLILFTSNSTGTDRIYYISFLLNLPIGKLLFQGDLNLRRTSPLETLSSYETPSIQKVYWVDGRNQPRFINIANISDEVISQYTSTSFDFSRPISLTSFSSDVEEEYNSGGLFAPGVILYAFAYHNLNGLLTPIIDFTHLHYVSYREKGVAADSSVTISFRIDLTGLDTSYDYIRVYAIHRTSLDAVPTVRIVDDLPISTGSTFIVDTGLGDSIDPTALLYVGGANIIAYTMTLKDNALFMGNISLNTPTLGNLTFNGGQLKDLLNNYATVSEVNKSLTTTLETLLGFYSSTIDNSRSSRNTRNFKSGETYRLGVIAQHETGYWSEVVYLRDVTLEASPSVTRAGESRYYNVRRLRVTLTGASLISTLTSAGFVRIRPVIVEPTLSDRTILCLGLLQPTVYNVGDRYTNNPFAQASWFARGEPMANANNNYPERTLGLEISGRYLDISHAIPEYRGNKPLYSAEYRAGEIQSIWNPTTYPWQYGSTTSTRMSNSEYVDNYKDLWFVDSTVMTLNSPDIEFSDELRSLSLDEVQMRVVGAIIVDNHESNIDFTLSSAPSNPAGGKFPTYSKTMRNSYLYSTGGIRVNSAEFLDNLTGGSGSSIMRAYPVYPWHRNGSLNNDVSGDSRTAVLDLKKLLNYRYSTFTYWLTNKISYSNGITPVMIFDKDDTSTITIPAKENSSYGTMLYSANVDKLYSPNFVKLNNAGDTTDKSLGYPIWIAGAREDGSGNTLPDIEYYKYTQAPTTVNYRGTDPIRISYRSTPHAVFATNNDSSGVLQCMPFFGSGNYSANTSETLFWGESGSSNSPLATLASNSNAPWNTAMLIMYLAELYRDTVTNRYGGTSESAILNNRWIVSGHSQPLISGATSVDMNYEEGDTYLMRYDCLKTYAYSDTSLNSVVDIVSFYCESRINLNQKYDSNRRNTSNLVLSPSNFNLYNSVYNQSNNFFTYRALDYDRFSNDSFPNQIAWTSPKLAGEEIDTWANINLASTLDLDGDKGTILSLQHFNNEIYAFQNRGVSHIIYNPRVLIPSSEGVPIEIANSGLVLGKRYITDMIGCQNKWSICKSAAGLYFMDNYQQAIYLFNGQSFDALSDRLGFSSWVSGVNTTYTWNPYNFYNYRSYYDATNGDIYFVGDGVDNVLGYSELLGVFTSFYSYGNTPAMFNVLGELYSFSSDNKFWRMFAGTDYNSLLGVYQPYSTTVIANQDPQADKIFNTVEFRGESRDATSSTLIPNARMFATINVETEYQTTGDVNLDLSLSKPAALKRKFRIWRINIPRSTLGKGMDRMRGPWAKVTLSQTPIVAAAGYKQELHDITVGYSL